MNGYLPHLLLISGNGRESGKTLFACSVISNLCERFKIIAVKISPHHSFNAGNIEDTFLVIEEQLTDTGKDTSRFLDAGAFRSFFIHSNDQNLVKAGELIATWCSEGYYVVCESGGLSKLVTPELFVIVNRHDRMELKQGFKDCIQKEHIPVIYDGKKFLPDPGKIFIEFEKWSYRYD